MTGGLSLPPGGGGIGDEVVAFAAGLIDRSGTAPVIEAALAHRTGRPRPLPVRAVLTALLCLALEDRPLFLTEATRLLFGRLSGTSRALLKVTGTASGRRGFLAAYRRVRYCSGAICSVMDPSALPKNRRLTADDLVKRTKPMTPAQIAGARGRLEAFLNCLLEATLSVLDQEESPAPTAPPAYATPCRCSPAARPGGPGCGQRPRRRLVRPRRRPPRTRGRQGQAAAEDLLGAGSHHRRHRPPARCRAGQPGPRHRPGHHPARRRPRRRRRPGARFHRRPRAQDLRGWATTAPTPRPCPNGSTCPPAPSATSPSWTTGQTSSASRQTPAEHY